MWGGYQAKTIKICMDYSKQSNSENTESGRHSLTIALLILKRPWCF